MKAENNDTTLIYVAYAPEDKKLWEALRSHMSVLQYHHRPMQVFDARNSLQEQARYYLKQAHIILLLLSPAFMQSPVCTYEMEYALARHRTQSAWIIPIQLRPLAARNNLPTSELTVIPPHNQSIQTAKHRDKIFADIVDEICKIIEIPKNSALVSFASETHLIDTPPLIDPNSIELRTSVVEKIYALLTHPGASGVLMTGLSGIGKTKLATLVYHHTEQLRMSGNSMFSDQSIWLEMNATTTLTDIVEALCRNLHRSLPSAWNLAPSILAQELFRLLNTLEHPRLIIFDQFDTLLDARTGKARNLQDGIGALLQLLAHHPCQCRLLLVSCFAPWGMTAYSPLHLLEFEAPPLETQEGVALLRLWGVQGWKNELENAVKHCQGHAQAIVCLQTVLKLDSNIGLSSLSHEATYRQRWIGTAAHDFLEYCYMHQLSAEQRLLLRSLSLYRQPVSQNAVLEMLRLEDQALSMPTSLSRRAALDVLISLKLVYSKQAQRYTTPPVVAESIRMCFEQEDEQKYRKAHDCAARYYIQLARDKSRFLKEERKK